MKNSILLLFLNLFFNCNKENLPTSSADNSIVDNKNVWYISEYPNYNPGCIWPHKITFGNDTIINSFVYKEVLDYRGGKNENDCKANNFGYLRETEDKKVFWNKSLFGRPAKDILIYDFNASINDTIDNYWVVKDIVTETILGKKRKKLSLVNCDLDEIYWIEGIGDLADLLRYSSRTICNFDTQINGDVIGASIYELNCVEKNESLIYKNSDVKDCWIYKE